MYFATRSVREAEPVLICPVESPTTRSAIVLSSVSPERWDTTAVHPARFAISIASIVSVTVPIWFSQLSDSALKLHVDSAERDRRGGFDGEIAVRGAVEPAVLLAKHQEGAAGLDQIPVGQAGAIHLRAVD